MDEQELYEQKVNTDLVPVFEVSLFETFVNIELEYGELGIDSILEDGNKSVAI